MITAVSAVIIFLLLIFIHEFGHFISAKLCGVTVLEFALGMGPAIFKKQWGETLYSLRIIPIGGYCKMDGEDESSENPGAFSNKNPYQRFIILFAGAFMNIILGFILFAILLLPSKEMIVPVIDKVVENSAAAEAGLTHGDEIIGINGVKVNIQADVNFELSRTDATKPVEIEYKRNGEKQKVSLTPQKDEKGEYKIGYYSTVIKPNFLQKLENTFYTTIFTGKIIIVSLGDLVLGKIGAENVSGPVGVVKEIGSAAKLGIDYLIYLTALITINLGIFNLLPIPALDGGRILFVLIEMITRKKLPAEKEGIVHFIGFALLIGLMIFATWQDILKFIK